MKTLLEASKMFSFHPFRSKIMLLFNDLRLLDESNTQFLILVLISSEYKPTPNWTEMTSAGRFLSSLTLNRNLIP